MKLDAPKAWPPPPTWDVLACAINNEWIRLYGGEPVHDAAALVARVRNIAADRDCWMANAKAFEKDRAQMESQLRHISTAPSTPNLGGLSGAGITPAGCGGPISPGATPTAQPNRVEDGGPAPCGDAGSPGGPLST